MPFVPPRSPSSACMRVTSASVAPVRASREAFVNATSKRSSLYGFSR
jgi:hypothetical protein